MNITGIYFYSPVYDISGYGNVARNFLLALEKLNIPVYVHAHGNYYEEIGEENIEIIKRISQPNTFNLGDRVAVIQHCDPSGLVPIKPFGVNVIKNIGMTIFETDRICQEWVDNCNSMDEIWIPTKFNYDTFKDSGVDEQKLKIIRYPVNTLLLDKIDGHVDFGRDLGFTFLYVSGYDYRKGYELLIDSFSQAFTSSDDVSLLLKIYVPNWSLGTKAYDELTECARKYKDGPKIYILNDKITTEDMLKLYNSVDAYVSTERASGWGMPEMEMMAIGKPVATINWGGTTEYMNSSNSFPIKVTGDMEYVDKRLQELRPTYEGHKWASVNHKDVSDTLLDIYNNKEKRDRISKQARNDVINILSPDKIAEEIKKTLEVY